MLLPEGCACSAGVQCHGDTTHTLGWLRPHNDQFSALNQDTSVWDRVQSLVFYLSRGQSAQTCLVGNNDPITESVFWRDKQRPHCVCDIGQHVGHGSPAPLSRLVRTNARNLYN